ncbi:hypothetical protein EKE94_04105 [Mesobaculum littorinae]|uniref:Uncharacterized protein n=2 Tax=Mesobaculum littorinae TaxID=2486419 RepID=A0A438AMH0_9RHOB|nr:hypothetical protein EKE94_04105 [Mesobaculum littorinae]
MTRDTLSLTGLRRPRLLIRAARHALADYDRGRVLRRLLPGVTGAGARVVARLCAAEVELEESRKSGACYDASRHIEVLTALMAEAALLPRRTA